MGSQYQDLEAVIMPVSSRALGFWFPWSQIRDSRFQSWNSIYCISTCGSWHSKCVWVYVSSQIRTWCGLGFGCVVISERIVIFVGLVIRKDAINSFRLC